MLRFLHLSDIHFRKWSGNSYDVDIDLRNELEIDAKAFSETHGVPDGILVTGDIAFSGKSEEYSIATDWLRELCDLVSCPHTAVWCVPGNHDVDQSITRGSDMLAEAQEKIRKIATDEPNVLNGHLEVLMSDPMQREYLFRPIEQYNKFAAVFGCDVTPTKPFWQEQFSLDDGTTIRLNGLTSTLVSNHHDQARQFVVVGEHQAPLRNELVVDVVLCHHPHDWIRGDEIKSKLDTRARLQLFGHKHRQAVRNLEHTVHLVAGAVHPERSEHSWEPRYNWIELSTSDNGNRKLKIKVFPRKWDSNNAKFGADYNLCGGNSSVEYCFEIPRVVAAIEDVQRSTNLVKSHGSSSDDEEPAGENEEDGENARVLAYRYLNLSHVQRLQVAIELGLLQDEDEGLPDFEIYERVFERAIAGKLLSEFWDRVAKLSKDGDGSANPYLR